jgi:multidrug efflux pump subunit AcrB
MNPATFALRNRVTTTLLLAVLSVAGVLAYGKLGKLEYPSFTIKTALVTTPYSGAGPLEVERQVTDAIEEAVQAMGQIKNIRSTSEAGVSYVYVDILDEIPSKDLPQIWDELRRKVADAQAGLPPGAGPSVVNDDFGDVYGVFFALTGPGYSPAQLKAYAQSLKKELLLCRDVARIEFWGLQQEVVYLEMRRARMARLGVSPAQIAAALEGRNAVTPGGRVEVDGRYIRIAPGGAFTSEGDIGDLLIGGASGMVRLRDVADVRRGYQDPPASAMLHDGRPAIGIGIATRDGGNVVAMGEAIRQRLAELDSQRPAGMELAPIFYQSEVVTEAVDMFLVNLAEAVVIVVVLLMLFMGWQSGLLIGAVLGLTILGTLAGMALWGIDLHKVSLGALILALGMLVDNAIVVADGILVRVQRGMDREQAAREVVAATQLPLLGATAVAVLAFTAIGFSPGNVGEFCRSLFQVMALSLGLSWVLAVTATPLLCVWFLKVPAPGTGGDPYDRPFFRAYRRFLAGALRHRVGATAFVLLLLGLALAGAARLPQSFFPDSTQRLFMVNYWKPEGAHIEATLADLRTIEQAVRGMEGVTGVTALAGQSALRFMLVYDVAKPDTSFGQLLVRVDDYHRIDALIPRIEEYIARRFPDAEPYCLKVTTGPAVDMKVEARFRGPDFAVLRELAARAGAVMAASPNVRDLRTDWRQQVPVLRPDYAEAPARRAGLTREDLAQALQWNFSGQTLGVYREGDELLPIIARAPRAERVAVDNLDSVQVFSSTSGRFVGIGQAAPGTELAWEQALIERRDRQRIVTVRCNPARGLAEPLRAELRPALEAIPLPPGYSMEWGGEHEDAAEAEAGIYAIFPLCLLGMFVTTVALFNSMRRATIIFLVLPLALVGVTAALLATGLSFGFMSILGFLGLSGMLIKNAIVLIDEVEANRRAGAPCLRAVLDAGVSRLRPVVMAAGTTILGMIPLLTDPLFASMAATIMGGLFAATFLTLVLVPVLYTLFFRTCPYEGHGPEEAAP